MPMTVIYKYAIPPAGGGKVTTIGGTIIGVGLDGNGDACFWVLGDKTLKAFRRLRVVGTGHDFHLLDYTFVGSWVEGPFVWHCFERNETMDRVKDGTAFDEVSS